MSRHHKSTPAWKVGVPTTMSVGEHRRAHGRLQGLPEVRGPWLRPVPGALVAIILAVIIFLVRSAPL
jgi:hypothetical protein